MKDIPKSPGNILILTYTSELSAVHGRLDGIGRDSGGVPHPFSFVAKRVL